VAQKRKQIQDAIDISHKRKSVKSVKFTAGKAHIKEEDLGDGSYGEESLCSIRSRIDLDIIEEENEVDLLSNTVAEEVRSPSPLGILNFDSIFEERKREPDYSDY
jgi:hypothetical protein